MEEITIHDVFHYFEFLFWGFLFWDGMKWIPLSVKAHNTIFSMIIVCVFTNTFIELTGG